MATLSLSSFLHSCFKYGDMAPQPQPNNWTELPEDLVVMIGERLRLYADYVRFRSICVSWYSALSKTPRSPSLHHHQFFPFLLLPPYKSTSRVLLSLPEKSKIYHLRGFPVKDSKSLYCLGSSHGWLVMAEDKATSTSMYLINPFTRVQLPLPPMSNLHRHVMKVVLSSSPASSSSSLMSSSSSSQFQSSSSQFQSSDDVVAVAIYCDRTDNTQAMAFSRPGDEAWKPLNLLGGGKEVFFDVLFYSDHLYALRFQTLSLCFDLLVFHLDMDMHIGGGRPVPKLVETLQVPGLHFKQNLYLVESCGDLLVIEREARITIELLWKTNGFRILKLCKGIRNSDDDDNDDKRSRSSKWVQIHNLDDRILFLGLNSSFSLSSHDFPGCTGNTIYFTHPKFYSFEFAVRKGGGYMMNSFDMGIFNLEDKRIKPLPLKDCKSRRGRRLLQILRAPPIWLTTTL